MPDIRLLIKPDTIVLAWLLWPNSIIEKEFFFNTWAPWTREDIDKLEGVQKRAVKAVSGLKGQSYEEKLAELKLPSLQNRRREIDMAQT